jgi:hypothetical protein
MTVRTNLGPVLPSRHAGIPVGEEGGTDEAGGGKVGSAPVGTVEVKVEVKTGTRTQGEEGRAREPASRLVSPFGVGGLDAGGEHGKEGMRLGQFRGQDNQFHTRQCWMTLF